MKKRIFLLSIGGFVLLTLTFALAFFVSQNEHDTYGFFSRVRQIEFGATTRDDKLILTFSPHGKGLGILELGFQRLSSDRFGTVSTVMRDIGNKKLLADLSYSTIHVDSSDPLLIPFRSFAKLGSNEYELTLMTDPVDLLPEYLVKQGLPLRGVYFIDREDLKKDYAEIWRLAEWKIADLQDTFPPLSMLLLVVIPLLTPFALYLLWYQYKKRLLRRVFVEYIIYYLLKPLEWSRKFGPKLLEPSRQTREVIWLHYKELVIHIVKTTMVTLIKYYKLHTKMVWDVTLVIIWAMACLVFSVTQTEITDSMYIRFAIAYLLFALFRRVDSRTHYFAALILLVFCPHYLSLKLDATAERVAIFVYGFMVAGAFFDAIELYRRKGKVDHLDQI
ncbi:MAG: hypothetical protein WCJ70_00680 [bacterium]